MSCSQLSRRGLLAAALASTQLRGANQESHQRPGSRPNVIVILFDDLGLHDLGYLGASDLKTPNIDKLAATGTVCRNWYSNAPVCAPARSALMTGRCPLRNGVAENGRPLRASERTVAAILKENGYATALTGKWHLGSSQDTVPNAHGFDYFYGFHEGCVDYYSHRMYWGEPKIVNFHDLWRNREEIFENGQYLTERIAEEASTFIGKQNSNPFFLYTAFNAVHYPMHSSRKYVERFPTLEPERQMYASMLSAGDDGVGQIMEKLQQTGQRENTLIFVLGDNGATRERRAGLNQQPATAGRNTPYRGFKFSTFDGGIHVPALVNWPGKVPEGKFLEELVMTADILPTVCHLAGAQMPMDRTIDGRNIWPVLTEGASSPHEYICWTNGPQLAIRRNNWKLVMHGIVHDGTAAGERPLQGDDAIFLSNLDEDPGETVNLRHKYPNVADELQTLAQQWRESVQSN